MSHVNENARRGRRSGPVNETLLFTLFSRTGAGNFHEDIVGATVLCDSALYLRMSEVV